MHGLGYQNCFDVPSLGFDALYTCLFDVPFACFTQSMCLIYCVYKIRRTLGITIVSCVHAHTHTHTQTCPHTHTHTNMLTYTRAQQVEISINSLAEWSGRDFVVCVVAVGGQNPEQNLRSELCVKLHVISPMPSVSLWCCVLHVHMCFVCACHQPCA